MRKKSSRRRAYALVSHQRIEASRFKLRDVLSESLAGILQRPARSALTSVGTVLGVGTLVAILGLTGTASSQIDERFNALSATEVSVEDIGRSQSGSTDMAFPSDADRRVERLNGVQNAGVYWPVSLANGETVEPSPIGPTAGGSHIQVVAASAGVLAAASPSVSEGRVFDAWHDATRQRVAVIGSGLASRLGVSNLRAQSAIFIGNEGFTVIGIVDNVQRKSDILLSVVIPRSTAQHIWGQPASGAKMLISTRVGAATQVSKEVSTALDPAHPNHFKVIPPPDPKLLRTAVNGDLDTLFLILSIICLFIGAIGIANTTLVAILERTGEIGLRRALGARGSHIISQFLTESAVLGAIGGLVGTSLGTLTVVAVSLAKEWTPVIHPITVATSPAIGLMTGLLAGLYPAWRASRIQPVEALRR